MILLIWIVEIYLKQWYTFMNILISSLSVVEFVLFKNSFLGISGHKVWCPYRNKKTAKRKTIITYCLFSRLNGCASLRVVVRISRILMYSNFILANLRIIITFIFVFLCNKRVRDMIFLFGYTNENFLVSFQFFW